MMTQGELILGVIGIIFIIAELWQVYALRRTMERAISDPEYAGKIVESAIFGFLQSMNLEGKTGKELELAQNRQVYFFGFLQTMGRQMMAGITGKGASADGVMPPPVKLKGWMKIFEPFVNNAQIQELVAGKVAKGLENTGTAGIDAAKKASEIPDF